MSSDESQRAALLALLGRKLAGEQAVKTVLFQQVIADRLGLNTTDLICLSLLSDTEPLTAGQLAEATGLTTGSVTVMIDRLEKAGYAEDSQECTREAWRDLAAQIRELRGVLPLLEDLRTRMQEVEHQLGQRLSLVQRNTIYRLVQVYGEAHAARSGERQRGRRSVRAGPIVRALRHRDLHRSTSRPL